MSGNIVNTMRNMANSPSNAGGKLPAGGGVLMNMTDEVDQQMFLLEQEARQEADAIVDKHGKVPGSLSLFNPFKVFRYSKFDPTGESYNLDLHFDTPNSSLSQNDRAGLSGLHAESYGPSPDGKATLGQLEQNFKPFSDVRKWIENPTASNIIEWSRLQTQADNTAITPTPYATTDFLWCKYYGKVPNNRMVTLRRYPLPVEDNLVVKPEKSPLVPIAQAVTWYGTDIGNPLSSILNLSWGMKWTPRDAKVQDITGNEITVEELAAAAGVEDEKTISILKSQVFAGSGGKVDILKLAGYDASIQDYVRKAYTADGPYWNRILGPVNVIDRTLIRDRGFTDQKAITLNFKYSLRAYGSINPKIAFLDLYSNFLSLTMNTAPFWGGGARYFQKTGITLPGFGMENKMLDGDVLGAISLGTKQIQEAAAQNIKALVAFAKEIQSGKWGDKDGQRVQDRKEALDESFGNKRIVDEQGNVSADPISKLLAPRIGEVLRKPLIYRAILDGRAVGEWHVTIGNPMNPMAVMGNLCLDTCSVKFGEVLGIDDFPTEVEFSVTLKHGRPRAKQDLESIFNLGNGALGYSQLPQPSSTRNSYGVGTGVQLGAISGNNEGLNIDPQGVNNGPTEAAGSSADIAGVSDVNMGNSTAQDYTVGNNEAEGTKLTALVDRYSTRVSQMYGTGFGNSPVLKDYFTELKTKD